MVPRPLTATRAHSRPQSPRSFWPVASLWKGSRALTRAHVPFGQHQNTELWNKTKILRLSISWRMRGLVYMASRDKVDVDTFHKGIQYALEKLGKSKFGFERTAVSNFKSKRHEGSGNEQEGEVNFACVVMRARTR